jgi:hypothetical protein
VSGGSVEFWKLQKILGIGSVNLKYVLCTLLSAEHGGVLLALL